MYFNQIAKIRNYFESFDQMSSFYVRSFGQNVPNVMVRPVSLRPSFSAGCLRSRTNKTSSSLDLRWDQFSSIIWSQMNGVGHAHWRNLFVAAGLYNLALGLHFRPGFYTHNCCCCWLVAVASLFLKWLYTESSDIHSFACSFPYQIDWLVICIP